MTIRWVFKNGYTFDTICDEFEYSLSENGIINGYSIKNSTKDLPISINFEELLAVIQLSDEESKEA